MIFLQSNNDFLINPNQNDNQKSESLLVLRTQIISNNIIELDISVAVLRFSERYLYGKSVIVLKPTAKRESEMYRIGAFAADMLNSIDNVAKETLEGNL